mgnify:CR=1 FL=1
MGVSNKALLPAGLLLLLAAAGYYFFTQDSQSVEEPLELTAPSAKQQVPVAADLPGSSEELLATSDPGSSVREEVAKPVEPELPDGLRIIRGKAVFNGVLPEDEELYVMNVSRKSSRQEIYRGPGDEKTGVSQLVWESGDEAANTLLDPTIETGLDLHLVSFAKMEADGSFELKVPDTSEVVHLAVAGRYSYSNGSKALRVGDEIEITGHVGAWVTGQLSGPLDLEEESPYGEVGVAIFPDVSAGFSAQEIQNLAVTIAETPDDQGRFEFRSVPVEYTNAFFVNSENFGPKLLNGLDGILLAPGQHHQIEVDLGAGATLRGVVMDEFMRPVTGGSVELRLPGAAGRGMGALRKTEVAEDGTFELTHVMTGTRMELSADPEGYLRGKEIIKDTLQDGDVIEDILLQVKQGLALSGRVTYEDGTPAENAEVSLGLDFAGLDPSMMGQVAASFRAKSTTTDVAGKFELRGLESGQFKLVASLETEEGERAGHWWAIKSGLKGDEQNLLLSMQGLGVLAGTVTTEPEAKVGELTARMTLKGSGGMMGIGAQTTEKSLGAPDEAGAFKAEGIQPGVWEVSLKADGFSATEKLEVTIPQAAGEPLPNFLLTPSASVSGIVLDDQGAPISGATVTLELDMAGMIDANKKGGTPKTYSDHGGKYLLEDVAPGSRSVHATMAGYAASEVRAIDLQPGELVEDVTLALRVGGSITGEVFDKEGEPASGRTIIVQKVPAYNKQHIMESDRDGRFFVAHLEPGQWQVVAMVNMLDGSLDTSDGKGTANMMENLLMEVADVVDGVDTQVILGAAPEDPLALTGKVVCDGNPVEGAVVVLRSAKAEGMAGMLMATTDASGAFSKTLADRGSYLVTVQTGMSTGLQNSIESMVTIPEGVSEHKVTIELPLGGIAGTIYGADGKPAAGCRVTMHVGDGIAYGSFLGGHYTEMLTDEDGNYSIEFLEAGKYDLSAGGSTMGGLMGDDSTLGRQTRTGVVVAEGEWVRGIDFKLREPCELRGKVSGPDGSPVAGAAVFVRAENGELVDRFSFVTTNASGKFTYTGLAEGRYRVTAQKAGQVSASSEKVRVASGEPATAEVQLSTGTMLLVSLVDDSGSELRPKVSVRDENGEEWAGVLSIEQIMAEIGKGFDNKEQRVGPLPKGKYFVVATLEDGRSARKVVNLDGQEERKARLRLK